MLRLVLLLVALATPVFCATMTALPVVWHGPGGPRGCAGACDRDWALGTLPGSVPRKLIELAIAADPDGGPVSIVSGDELVMMSYAIDGTPYADLRGGVAALDAPEPATGWTVQADGETWIFGIVHGCRNWALVRQPTYGSKPYQQPGQQPGPNPGQQSGQQSGPDRVSRAGAPARLAATLPLSPFNPRIPVIPVSILPREPQRVLFGVDIRRPEPVTEVEIPPVPLVGSGGLAVLALGAMACVGAIRARTRTRAGTPSPG